jgi:hypothetical protein
MLLFIAYPGVSLKVLRLFKCRYIDGSWWLVADMRLRCYDSGWAGMIVLALLVIVVYVVGFPAAVLWLLWKRRHALFATDAAGTELRTKYGFLYEVYGPSAWWWEVEELLRKLLLSAVVVLIEEGSPLQVTLAVLVSGWAHVLHAQFKPWGAGTAMYRLQHGSLFVTSFVFLMGLLFKVHGVSSSSPTYRGLSGVMVTLCMLFIAAWCTAIALAVRRNWRARRVAASKGGDVGGAAGGSGAGEGARGRVAAADVFQGTNPLLLAKQRSGVMSNKTGTERGLTSKLSSRPMRPRAAPGMASAPTGSESEEPSSAAADGGSADEANSIQVVRRGSMADTSSEAAPGTGVGGVVVASAGPLSVVGARARSGGGDDGGASRRTTAMASYFSAVRHKRPNGGSAGATIVRNPAAKAATDV